MHLRLILFSAAILLASQMAQADLELNAPPVVGGYEDVSPATQVDKPVKKLLKKSYVAQEKAKMKDLKRKQAMAFKKLSGSKKAGK